MFSVEEQAWSKQNQDNELKDELLEISERNKTSSSNAVSRNIVKVFDKKPASFEVKKFYEKNALFFSSSKRMFCFIFLNTFLQNHSENRSNSQ